MEKMEYVGRALHFRLSITAAGMKKIETLKMLEGIVDIYLTDFKYLDSDMAKRYSKAPDYPGIVKDALTEMVRQQETPVFDVHNMMKKGVIVRHLLLPGYLKNAEDVVKYVYGTYGDKIYLTNYPEINPGG